MRIKITGCSGPRYWYADKIGMEYVVVEINGVNGLNGEYAVRGGNHFVAPEDCKVIVDFEMEKEYAGLVSEIRRIGDRMKEIEDYGKTF